MAIPFDEILTKLSPEVREKADRRAAGLIAEERTLREIREAMELSQAAVAEALGVKQAAVSKLERRVDLTVSNLRSYLRSVGAELEIFARIPGQPPIPLTQFGGPPIPPAKRGRKASASRTKKATPRPAVPGKKPIVDEVQAAKRASGAESTPKEGKGQGIVTKPRMPAKAKPK